jgi:hypothetical protein
MNWAKSDARDLTRLLSAMAVAGGTSTPEGGDMHQVFLLEDKALKYNLHSPQPAAEKRHRFTTTISRYSLGTTIVLSSAVFMRPMRSYRSFSSRIC